MTPEATPGPTFEARSARGRNPGRRCADREPVNGWFPTLAVGIGVALLDWVSKALVVALLPQDEFVEVLSGSLGVWHVRNPAMILGLYGELPIEIRKTIALAAGAAGLVLIQQVIACGHRLPPRQRPWAWLFVGLMMGGMLGNLGERLVHWGVTDFISIAWGGRWLPPGNFADLALFAAVPLAVVVSALELLARTRRGATGGSPAEVMGD
jgi:lipoprotein signal peptidase